MRVDTSLLQGITAANNAAVKAKSSSLTSTGTTTSFSSALKTASTEKETTKPVEGESYAEILTGPRAGMYVNTSGNARDGEAFILVKGKDGSEQHIYGTGKDRKVVSSGSESSATADKTSDKPATSKAPANETVKQVEGRAYADILTGSRNGLYLNTSTNARSGQVFSLVMKEGREYHIYGTGKDRQVIGLRPKPETTEETPSTTDKTATTDPSKPSGTVGSGPITDSATT
ncbi:hypothetical protein C8N24_1684 [Solirubrobacter pauli]|uniref:Uncharacterized protein n=1 Tax=Solirubrobacter pauli TaxID=166793 RepID=A0A660LGH3_9ACTN|nr:hypothetical protein [Solirubrobacter pauli]RKQ91851.1 hypothetical protein C8N24_1684 [Solirubrobacter pauli]